MTGHDFPDALKQLLDEFSRSGIRELHIRKPDFELYLSTDASAARPQAATPVAAPASVPVAQPAAPSRPIAAPPALISSMPDDAIIIKAPNLGTFYRAPKPGAANYVEVGSKVQAGDELCLIEVMKLFTAVRAGSSGTVQAVLVEDGAMVEGGQPLFALVRD
ncbi:acetyl-CoA carboxylase biotin carboxyl carrier protein [Sphingomonas sp. VDB2]|uniref:acetyl-CoA carboxylase biotin carboxyl carrier protein n=1 Tax=Sphingomonas sp. VDB2 TaxID=3228751 RepID=UPI003A7FBE4C